MPQVKLKIPLLYRQTVKKLALNLTKIVKGLLLKASQESAS